MVETVTSAVKAVTPFAPLAGAAVGAYAQVQSGKAAEKAAEHTARNIDKEIARTKEVTADDRQEEERRRRATQATLRALRGGTGGSLNTGSSLLISDDINDRSTENQDRINRNESNAVEALMDERSLTIMSGKNARRSSYLRGGSTLLSALDWD